MSSSETQDETAISMNEIEDKLDQTKKQVEANISLVLRLIIMT